MYKSYVTEQLPQEYEVSRVDQADYLNKSINFFKDKEEFEIEEFKNRFWYIRKLLKASMNIRSSSKKKEILNWKIILQLLPEQ